MKKMLNIAMGLLFILSGCSITQEFSFNKDYSGKMSNSIDFSMLKSFMGEEATTEDNSLDSIETVYKETVEKLKDVKGISDVKLTWENNNTLLVLSYQFDGVEALNNSLVRSEFLGEQEGSNGSFAQKGKKLTYLPPKMDLDSLKQTEGIEESGEYFSLALKFNFERQIKKVSNKKVELSDSNHKAALSNNLNEIMKGELEKSIEFKLK